MARALPALPPATGCRTCGQPGFKLCPDCARVSERNQELDWTCQVCGQPTNAYNAVRANLHRACELLPATVLSQVGMVEFCDAQNASLQARLFGGAR